MIDVYEIEDPDDVDLPFSMTGLSAVGLKRVVEKAISKGYISDGRPLPKIGDFKYPVKMADLDDGVARSFVIRPRNLNSCRFSYCEIRPSTLLNCYWISMFDGWNSGTLVPFHYCFQFPVYPSFIPIIVEQMGFPVVDIDFMSFEEAPMSAHPHCAKLSLLPTESPIETVAVAPRLPSRRRKNEDSVVYFIRNTETGMIKIGHAINPDERMRGFQTGSSAALELIGTMFGGQKKERELHKRFKHLRARGEWFHAHDSLSSFITKHANSATSCADESTGVHSIGGDQ